jgi:DHA2 family multidrug resistance protein
MTEEIVKIDKKTWLAFICMVFGMFMAVLDIQIVSSSLKEIQAGLSATQDEINWIQSAYLIAEVIIIPMSAWLCRTFSTRMVFGVACAGFTIMSLACALSWDLNSMIMFRALQGFFGGAMIPSVFAAIFVIFPLKMRPSVTVVIGLVVTVAPISGPVLGGYITEFLSWHYLFLLNIIPGILVTWSVLKFVNFDQPRYELLKNIDFLGIVLISICLASFQYILEEGTRKNWLESHLIKILSIMSFLSFIALIRRELSIDNPIINLRAFKDRNFTCGCVLSFILGWGMYSSVFIMPIFLGSIKGLNSMQVGEYLFVMGAFQFLSAPCAGILSKKIDLRIMMAMGMSLFGLGCFLNYNISYDSGFYEFFLPQAVRGFSLMLCFLPITSLTFATLPPSEVPTASGLYNLMRNLGGAIGLAICNSWLQNWTKANYLPLREHITETNDLSNNALAIYQQHFMSFNIVDSYRAAVSVLYQLAQREAYIITFSQVFIATSLLFFASVLLIPLIKKIDPNAKASPDAH